MTAHTRRQVERMAGEFFREAGVLVVVLSPLESLVTHGRLTLSGTIATLLIAGSLLTAAFWLGLERNYMPESLIPVTILGTIVFVFALWLKLTDPERPRGRRKP